MNSGSDQLFTNLKKAKRSSYEALYTKNYHSVERFVLKNNGTVDDAKDIFQDTMHVLLVKLRSDNFELAASIDTYIYGISKNLWLKRLRNISYSKEIELDNLPLNDFCKDINVSIENEKTFFEKLKTVMGKLSAHCYHLLSAIFLENKGIIEIQKIFGYTTKHNAQNQKYKCIERAKKIKKETDGKNY